MRILHIWNPAAVASIYAKYQRKMGHDAEVLASRRHDKWGFSRFYGAKMVSSPASLYRHALQGALHADVVHVHGGLSRLALLLRSRFALKPLVVEYHGTNVFRGVLQSEGGIYDRLLKFVGKKRTVVAYSTPDLGRFLPQALYIANPVDTELFSPRGPGNEGALHIQAPWWNDAKWAREWAASHHVPLTIYDRERFPIPYYDMPRFLGRFGYLIDRRTLPSLSKTGLEALAVGLKVVNWREDVLEGLPREHHPEEATRRVLAVYQALLGR